MTFKELLAEVIDWLQQDQRLTYRALKRQFDLDDKYVEDLKDELIEAKQIAKDENGRVLVWVVESNVISELDLVSPVQPEAGSEPPSPLVESSPPDVVEAPDAERRQLTVTFVDLVGSTRLSGTPDPEDTATDTAEVSPRNRRGVGRAVRRACGHGAGVARLSLHRGRVDRPLPHFFALTGLRRVYNARRELRRAQDIGEQLLALARDQQDSERLTDGTWQERGRHGQDTSGGTIRFQRFPEARMACRPVSQGEPA